MRPDDEATLREESRRKAALAFRYPVRKPSGFCFNCEAPVPAGYCFCIDDEDDGCKQDFEKRERANAIQRP